MKNLKRLMAVVLAVVMLSTVAMAANVSVTEQANYKVFVTPATITQGTTEFTVGIGIMDTRTGATVDIATAAGSQANLLLYNNIAETLAAGITITGISSDIVDLGSYGDNYLYGTDEEGMDGCFGVMMTPFKTDGVKLSESAPIFNITCSINPDAAAGTYSIAKGEYSQADLADGNGEGASAVIPETLAIVTVEAGSTAEDISVAVEDAAYTAVKGATETYTGVWVGSIEKELEGKTMTAAKLVFGDNVNTKDLAVDSAIGGNGSVAFKIAVLGVPRVEGTMTPAYDAAVVLTVK